MSNSKTKSANSRSPQVEVVSPSQDRRDESQGDIGTLDNVLSGGPLPQVEVAPVAAPRPDKGDDGMVTVRVNEDITDMSYLAGGKRARLSFKQGHQYRVPVFIAQELEATGRVWH